MKSTSRFKVVQLPRVFLLCAGALVVTGQSAFAANDLWIGNTDSNFATLANWTGSASPNGNTPEFGVAGTSGTSLTSDISGATYAGFLFDSGASAYTIGGNSFTLSGNVTNSSSSLQTINNAITLNNAAHTFAATSGDIVLGGNISGTTTRSATFTGSGTTTLSGTNAFNMNGGGNNSFYTFSVGTGSGTSPTSGNVSITGATTVDGSAGTGTQFWGYLTIVGNSNLTIQSGGSLDIKTSAATNLSSGVGNNAAGTSTLRVNGGSFSLNGNGGLLLGNNRADATGVLTIDSGTATLTAGSTTLQDVRNMVVMGRDGATGIINLNGGTLATGRQFVRDGSSGGIAGTGTATFNFNGGTLQAQANQTQGNGWFETATTGNFQVVTTNVLEGGAKIDTNGFNVNINTALVHAGSNAIDGGLVKNGTGVLSLGGTNTFTGNVAVNAGTLQISGTGDINASSGVTINGSGAKFLQTSSTGGVAPITLTQGTLDGTGAVGAVTVGNGTGGIVTNGNGSTSTLTVASLAFDGAGTINLNKANDTSTPALAITGIFTTMPANGQISLNLLTGPPTWTNGSTYNLISYGSFTGANTDFTLGAVAGLGARQSATLGNTGAANGFITLAIAGDTPVWTGAANANWTTTAQPSPFNWKLQTAGTGTQFLTNDQVLFDDTATGTTAINIADASVSPVSVVFNNSSKNYSISSSGGFGIASGSLLKGGTGSLTLYTSNTYSGGTTLNAGTLNINNASAIGTGALTIASGTAIDNTSGSAVTLSTNNAQFWNGDFAFGGSNDLNLGTGAVTLGSTVILTTNGAGTLTVGGVIGGTGFGITKEGSGTLALNGANTFDGGVIIDAGTVRIGNAAALGTSTNSLTFGSSSGAKLQVNGNPLTVRGIDGDITATIENSNVINGTLTVNATTGSSFGGTIQDGSAGTLAVAKNGAGTLTLTGANTYSGGTTLNAGTLSVGGNSALGTGTVTVNGGAISSAAAATLSNAFVLNGGITFNATIDALTLNGNITGSPTGSLILNDTNLITLGGTNNLTLSSNFAGLLINNGFGVGGVAITGSTTISGNAANTNSGYIGVSGDTTVTVQSGGSLTVNGTTNAGTPNSIVGQNAAGTSVLAVNGGSFTVGGNTGFALGNGRVDAIGVLTISSGTTTILAGSATATDIRSFISLGRASATGTVNLNGGVLATGRNFVRDGEGTADVAGAANFVFGGGTLQALANQPDWLNSTTKNTNQLALSSVTVTATSTIDSNGFNVGINSAISGAGGFIKAGAGTLSLGGANSFTGGMSVLAGTLSLASNITLDDSITLSLASGTTLDLAFASGSETVAGLVLNGFAVDPGTYTAADLNTLGTASSINFTSAGGTLTVAPVPEPGTVALISLGLLFGMLAFRRSKAPTIS